MTWRLGIGEVMTPAKLRRNRRFDEGAEANRISISAALADRPHIGSTWLGRPLVQTGCIFPEGDNLWSWRAGTLDPLRLRLRFPLRCLSRRIRPGRLHYLPLRSEAHISDRV